MSTASSEIKARRTLSKKKILENPLFASFIVPLAIVLVGAVIIFGVSSVLTTKKSHDDLLDELDSRSFSNKGASAYELSKMLAVSKFDAEEKKKITKRLMDIYVSGPDLKTKNFLIVAMGALEDKEVLPVLKSALNERDSKIQYNALAAIGNLPPGSVKELDELARFFSADDPGLTQLALLATAQHKLQSFAPELIKRLQDPNKTIRYTAAMGLLNFKNELALGQLEQILSFEYGKKEETGVDDKQLIALKVNILDGLLRNQWKVLADEVKRLSKKDEKKEVAIKAQEVLNLLKY